MRRSLSIQFIATITPFVMGQDSSADSAKWKHYLRGGGVQVTNDTGLSGYYRINRSSRYAFGDLRLYLLLGISGYIYMD